jgi:hypothetical protein
MAGEDVEPVAAAAAPARRDPMGQAFHTLHLAIMTYFVVGWAAPWHDALYAYLLFVPAVLLQWRVNRGACVLNNLESWIRSGRWRDPGNREEGAWLATLCEDNLGIRPTPFAVDVFTHTLLLILWVITLIHLLYF